MSDRTSYRPERTFFRAIRIVAADCRIDADCATSGGGRNAPGRQGEDMAKVMRVASAAFVLILAGCGDGSSAAGSDAAVAMTQDAAVGAPYGSAGPRTCPARKEPADGAPSLEQAAAYATCHLERESSQMLYLVDKLVVTDVGKPRVYNPLERVMSQIDVERPVYDIRGRYDSYQCRMIATSTLVDMGPTYQKGANCNLYDAANATGSCYVDTFGDWHCILVDAYARKVRDDAPAPF
jgi:hypothetical protein